MRFLLDHNVLRGIFVTLQDGGHDVAWSKHAVGQEAKDPLVATHAMKTGRILVSHDNDMKRIQRFLSPKDRKRYPELCRLMLQCDQATAFDRLRSLLPLIEIEFSLAQDAGKAFLVWVQPARVVICR